MTLSDDLNFAAQATGDEPSSPYPTAFGITFTPPIIGGLVGGIGILASLYLVLNVIMPAWDTYQKQQSQSNELKGQVEQKRLQAKEIDKAQVELDKVKQEQTNILGLFADQNSMQTLLIDANRLIESSNGSSLSDNQSQAKLLKFTPVGGNKPEIITDGSYGDLINNKLKRRRFDAQIVGTFAQTQEIMRNLERLRPLLIVKNYQSSQAPVDKGAPPGLTLISTSFQLEALMPLTPEEIADAAKAPKK
jgi:type IV pilus assembly protein PilO